MTFAAFLFALVATINVEASERTARNMMHDIKVCEETASLLTAAYTLHPVDAQERFDFIKRMKNQAARETPDLPIEDRHLLPALGAITFHLVELDLLSSTAPVSIEAQARLAARSGAACGFLSQMDGAP